MSNQELELVQRLQKNDADALGTLMKLYYMQLYNYASRFSQDDSLIKDCIQEVFISLWQKRDIASSILSPKYYLLRAVKNKVLKSLHKLKLTSIEFGQLPPDIQFFQEVSIEELIVKKQLSEEKAQKLQLVLNQLSLRQKEIIYLKYYQHLDHGQIAELMNISRQSVYNLLHETIQKLRSFWHSELVPKHI
jgi:RNA polymerase sigma factor (sigma-70 family)